MPCGPAGPCGPVAPSIPFVPAIPMNKKWNDELLYRRYDIDDNEISFIDSMIRTMEWKND